MQLTNKMRLPQPIVDAVSNDSYTKGTADISVTELLLPPQLRRLRQQYATNIVEDASDRIWSLLGQAVHSIIERSSQSADVLSETTIYSEYLGWVVKGTCDHITLSSGELNDFKVTTVWKVLNNQAPSEWIEQTNIYRRLLGREKGIGIGSIAVIAILRDWSKREAERRQDYPQAQVVRLEIPIWSDAETDAFIEERIRLHQMEEPIGCSDADIWAKPSKWAVMRKGRQSAIKLHDSEAEAHAWMQQERISGGYLEYRPGVATRCESYCPVSQWCPQWANDPRHKPATNNGMENLFGEV